MIALVLALALSAHPACVGDGHNAHRSRAAIRHFRAAHPCPGGPDKGSTKHCRGWIVDHVCSLACCGLDLPVNMQWQSLADAKAKDRWEGNCSTCNSVNR